MKNGERIVLLVILVVVLFTLGFTLVSHPIVKEPVPVQVPPVAVVPTVEPSASLSATPVINQGFRPAVSPSPAR